MLFCSSLPTAAPFVSLRSGRAEVPALPCRARGAWGIVSDKVSWLPDRFWRSSEVVICTSAAKAGKIWQLYRRPKGLLHPGDARNLLPFASLGAAFGGAEEILFLLFRGPKGRSFTLERLAPSKTKRPCRVAPAAGEFARESEWESRPLLRKGTGHPINSCKG